jgi:hypothetical protein
MEDKLPKPIEWLLPIVTCFIGLHFTILGVCHCNLSMIPGDLGDTRFNMYILEHGFQFITRQVHYFWGAPFFYPFSPALALSDNLIGSMPVYATFRILSFDRETAFQLWFIMLCILNFFATFYVLKKLTNHTILALAGAYVFAFSIFHFSQFNHAQTFPRFIMPLVIYWMIRYFENYKLKYFWMMITGIAYQFYCGMYLGIYLSLTGFILFLILLSLNYRDAQRKRFFSGSNLYDIAFPLSVFILMLMPIAIPYLRFYSITSYRNYNDTFATIPIPSSYFFSHIASIPWYKLSLIGIRDNCPWWDQTLFVGIIPWLGMIASIVFFFKKGFIASNKALFSILITLLICILLTTRFGNFTLFKWLFKLPGISSMGTVPRIMNMFVLFFAMIPCLFMNSIIKKRRTLWFSILLLAIIIDNSSQPSLAFSFNKQKAQARVNAIVEKLHKVDWKGKQAFAYMPDSGNESEIQIDGMMASQLVHKPCVNGYSATSPKGFAGFWLSFNERELYNWLDFNQMDHATIVQIK